MKFSHTLSLNANPDWAKHYVDYPSLKKLINEVVDSSAHPDPKDSSSALGDLAEEPSLVLEGQNQFLNKLLENVTGVREFYYQKLAELNRNMFQLKPILEKSASTLDLVTLANEESSLLRSRQMKSVAKFDDSTHNLEDIRREICDMFTQYHNLQTYASLNCTAVRKILKKYDKTLNTKLQEKEMDSFKALLPFWDGTPDIDRSTGILKQYFAHFFCNGDTNEASRRLQLMVRELVAFQRRSIWLDVIKDQREHESAKLVHTSEKLEKLSFASPAALIISLWNLIRSSVEAQFGIISVMLFLFIIVSPEIFPDDPTKRNALALFVFVSLLWAGEVFPLFVTSLLVPFLAVVLRVVVVDDVRLDAHSASKHVFSAMFSHVIMLLIGGFSIAAALSKHNIAKVMASSLASRCGSGMRVVLLVNMFVATFASMWISNVASPVLCYSLISPILKSATAETSGAAFGTKQQTSAENDRRLCRALVMGIALASNVGGMASPISSPQNLFAIEYTPIGWLAWFTVSIPLCIALNLILWAWLIFCFRLPSGKSAAVSRSLQRNRASNEEHFTVTQYFVMSVSGAVVLLWCANMTMERFTGQMGVLGIIPFVVFFGTHILTKEDLNNFLWSIVLLAMGGLVLGEVIESSGLLDVMAEAIAGFIELHSLSLWSTMCIFTLVILFCTTFISHTVGAIVVLPILQSIGSHMVPTSHAKELVFAGALACSAAMGLPVSGFPNMTAASQEDHLGKRFLITADFLKYAVPASIISWAVVSTFGYVLILFAVEIDH